MKTSKFLILAGLSLLSTGASFAAVECGPANGQTPHDAQEIISMGMCNGGSISNVVTSNNNTVWSWNCAPGVSCQAQCTAGGSACLYNGGIEGCGPANGNAFTSANEVNDAGLCGMMNDGSVTQPDPSSVAGPGPWNRNCIANDGSAIACSASVNQGGGSSNSCIEYVYTNDSETNQPAGIPKCSCDTDNKFINCAGDGPNFQPTTNYTTINDLVKFAKPRTTTCTSSECFGFSFNNNIDQGARCYEEVDPSITKGEVKEHYMIYEKQDIVGCTNGGGGNGAGTGGTGGSVVCVNDYQAPSVCNISDPLVATICYYPPSDATFIVTNGKVGINNMNPGYELDVNGTIRAAHIYTLSDERAKENIQKIDNALEKIREINGYEFTWKKDGKADMGVLAQEIEKVFADAVRTDDNGMKTVQYTALLAPIIEAIHELNDSVDAHAIKAQAQANQLTNIEKQIK